MKKLSRKMLEEILEAENLDEVMEAMRNRLAKGIKYTYLKPKPIKKIIKQLDKELTE